MTVRDVVEARRAYRSLDPFLVTDDLIRDLAHAAALAPSCFNNQPWRYVFVRDRQQLQSVFAALSKGNQWVERASMVIAVFSRPELDCVIKDRSYAWFDTGMATAALILRATELGLVAHPIAGFRPDEVRPLLGIPETMQLLVLVIVGKHAASPSPVLSEKQLRDESLRPERLPFEHIAFIDRVPAGAPVMEPIPH